MNITTTIDDRKVQEALSDLQLRLSNMHPVMTRIGAFYERSVLENFKAEKSPDGTPWKKPAADTLIMGMLRRKGFGKKYK
jgi:phage gpG-like protein